MRQQWQKCVGKGDKRGITTKYCQLYLEPQVNNWEAQRRIPTHCWCVYENHF